MNQTRTTLGKALYINQDPNIYGTFAEIGAGQEVARFFFQAGKASQTIAKTISAYDMTFSDEIYGREPHGRYVCESRLDHMLSKEYELLPERLDTQRGDKTRFFAFATTVATSSDANRSCHGWMGVRFQVSPRGPTNDIVMHVRMLDRYRLQQQEVLGILGVNLIFAAFYHRDNPTAFVDTLTEGIKNGRLSIDLIRFKGPDLKIFDDLFMNVELVRRQLCNAAVFGPQNNLLYSGDLFYQKPLMVSRGTFAPPTNTHFEIIEKAQEQILTDQKKAPMVLCEISLPEAENFTPALTLTEDLRHRIKMLNNLGYHVAISRFPLFFELKTFLRQYTSEPIQFVVSAAMLSKLFDDGFYKNLKGGLLEGLGLLLDEETSLYVYPHKTADQCTTMNTFFLGGAEQKIFDYFKEKKWIKELGNCELANLSTQAIDVRKAIMNKEDISSLVPSAIDQYLKKHRLYH